MIEEDYKKGWKQHFPTYHFNDRDIALEEYKVAAKNLETEERVFLSASNVTLVSSAAFGSLLIGSSEKLTKIFDGVIPSITISIWLLVLVMGFSFISLKYFSDRQKAIIFAGRKVIILRRMLGLSYGNVQLLLPNWRVEGADQPLALKLFPGWMTYVAYPFWVIMIISCSVLFFLSAYLIKANSTFILQENVEFFVLGVPLIWFFLMLIIYRMSLLDTHERLRLLICKFLSKSVGLPIVENTEYIIYRARLAAYETDRLKVNLKNLERMLVFIEDRGFYKHSGISYKSLVRATLGQFGFKRRSGGSTIIQQLIRTLFICNLSMTIRRKFAELGMAPWFNQILRKEEILAIYLSSVRFERGKFGVVEAMKYYWGKPIISPSSAQAFFLIERVSNTKSSLLFKKIIETARNAEKQGVLLSDDLKELNEIYLSAVNKEKINASETELKQLSKGLNA